MTAGVFLTDVGNIGLIVSAALTTAAVCAYAVRGMGGLRTLPWWRTPFGLHIMCFMAAFAVVLDEAAVYLITTRAVLVEVVPFHVDWFAWTRVISYIILIPAVLAWRLWIILWPPGRKRRP
jgi:hypothetical protein